MIDTQEILSNINIFNKYAKHLPKENRRENWKEIVDRNKTMHIEKFPQLKEEIEQAYSYVYRKEILPSMRSLQFSGKPISVNPTRSYNCSALAIDSYKAFGEVMFLLLSGTGVGISVQKHHVEKLPPIRKPIKTKRFLVGDSIEGWSDAVHHLVKAFFTGGARPKFDFSDIRPKGAKLITSGGKAPGPAPLKIALIKIETLLDSIPDGTQIKPINAHDLCCHISDSVLAGGIRRSAMVSLFSIDDEDMLHAKSGAWWELNPQRGRANNSVVLIRSKASEEDFKKIWKAIENSKAGEPGIMFSNDKDTLSNPCFEISLKPMSFCNLVEINVSNIKSQEDLNSRAKSAAFIATLQASYTDFHFLRSQWKKNAEEEALIGVSMTGIADGEMLQYNIKESANIVNVENERVANLIGINKARRTTAIKPSGNSSVVLKSSSGIHARYAPYYWRRMRIGKNESLYTYLCINAPEILEDDIRDPSLSIVKVAVKSPEHSIFRNESPIQLLERVKKFQNEWIVPGHRKGANHNNVSCTVSVKENEWDIVGNWMWNNREHYNGLSVLDYDGGSYVQMPYEECVKEDYNNFCEMILFRLILRY